MISSQQLQFLTEYITDIHTRTPDLLVRKPQTDIERVTSNMISLMEEVGEVSAEVRKYTKLSFNEKKCDSFDPKNLEDELVDVLITMLLLSKSVGIESLDEAIARKIEKNRSRGY